MARHHVVFGLGFGDEGKGTLVDYLSKRGRPTFVVRFNGGAQAAHNVLLADGTHHTFAQYGSGTLQGARTFLSRFMIVSPGPMLREREALIQHLGYPPPVHVDGHALVTTPYHVGLNQLREACLKHGSCGMGIGETKRWEAEGIALRAADLRHDDLVARLGRIRECLLDVGLSFAKQAAMKSDSDTVSRALSALSTPPNDVAERFGYWLRTVAIEEDDWLQNRARLGDRFVFEGAQGVLLDETHGWAPHYTWSTCTPRNAVELATEAGIDRDDVEVTGVLRAYHTRHGAGPLPTEWAKDAAPSFHEAHNSAHQWQGDFRWGKFDGRLARYALEVSGRVDSLAITHVDRMPWGGGFTFCRSYAGQPDHGKPDIDSAEPFYEVHLGVTQPDDVLRAVRAALPSDAPPITIASMGPTAEDKLEQR